MEYTNPHTLPSYITIGTITRSDGALYIHAHDEILNTNTAATVDPLEWPCASLRDRLYDNLIH